MNKYLHKIFLVGLLFISLTNIVKAEDDAHFDLTDDNFDDFIKSNDFVLVKFYAPWCGHCKKMAPDFAAAAKELVDTPYKFAKVDATVHTKIAQQVGLQGYPTLKFYIKGEEKEFTGERTKDAMVEWVKNRAEKYIEQENNRQEGEPEMDENVVILTDALFDNYVKSNDYVFVKFYAPWCGHCKKMAPNMLNAANTLIEQGSSVKIAKLDATKETNVAQKVGIRGYPTIKFYYKGQMIEYSGGREAQEIVEWVTKKSKNPSTEVFTVNEIEELKENNDVVVVLFGGVELETFIAFGVAYDHAVLAHTFDEEVAAHYKAKQGSVVMFKNFDEKRNELPGVYSIPTLVTFVDSRSIPSLMNYDSKYNRFIYGSTPTVVFFYDYESEKADTYDDILYDLSKRVKGRFLVVKSDIKDGDQKKFSGDLGIKTHHLPGIFVLDNRNAQQGLKKYRMEGYKKLNSNTIRKFLNEFLNGNVEEFLKSEDEPEHELSPVVTLVGNNFKRIVLDETKDVLVEFYAPWCGHCQKLAPTYEQLARTLEDNTNLVIAKMDSTANEAPGVAIQGYPTIKFYPANNKKSPIDYKRNQNDTIDDFINFMKEHASNKITTGLEIDDDDDDDDDEKDDL